MSRSTEGILSFIAAHLRVAPALVQPETRFVADLGLDSFGAIDLIGEIEHRFDCQIPDADVRGVSTVGDLLTLLGAGR